MNLSTMAV